MSRDLVSEVLVETRRRERVRLPPAHVAAYFVVAMAVLQDNYEEVMRRLVGGLRAMRAWRDDWKVPATGAISQVRECLCELPMRLLFERVAVPQASPGMAGAWLAGRRLRSTVCRSTFRTRLRARLLSVYLWAAHAVRSRRSGPWAWANAPRMP